MFEFNSDLHVGDSKFEVLEGSVRVSPVVLMQDDFFKDHLDYGFDFFASCNLRTKDVNVVATYYPEDGGGHGEVVNLPLTQYEKSELIDIMETFCKGKYKVGCLELLNMQRDSVGIRRMDNLSGLDLEACAQDLIRTFAGDGQWLDGDDLEELEKIEPYLGEVAIGQYLHGCCDEWVLEHFQPGDVAVVWNEFSEDIGKVCLIHCYIQRGDVFLDVRGETDDEELVEEGFDYGYDNEKVYCDTLEVYKEVIRDICGYELAQPSLNSLIVRANDGRVVREKTSRAEHEEVL